VEKAPVVFKQGIKKEEVESIKKIIVDAGGTVEVI
jgi:ribosomal protein L7/L12